MTTHAERMRELASLKREANTILERTTDDETRLLALGCIREIIATEHRFRRAHDVVRSLVRIITASTARPEA